MTSTQYSAKKDKLKKILIIGYGFSAIPLVVELEKRNEDFLIITEKDTVWRHLHDKKRLDFDLVSSKYTTYYSYDLITEMTEDNFPTAQEFFEYQFKYFEQHKKYMVDDFVTHIDNYSDHSVVRTKRGDTYEAENLILATGYQRRITSDILNFDTTVSNKTIVFDTIGDTANMIIAKMVGQNNKIIALQNGFISTDKAIRFSKVQLTLDQIEAHNVGFYFKGIYSTLIVGGINSQLNFMLKKLSKVKPFSIPLFLRKLFNFYFISKLFNRNDLQTKHGTGRELDLENVRNVPKFPFPNGLILIKHWPIDSYYNSFSKHLLENIKKGYVLNDIAFFIDEGLVTLRSKSDTIIDESKKTISTNGETIHYDHLIKGGPEEPRFPSITIHYDDTSKKEYSYRFKDTYFGVVPKGLNNIYFMGLARPISGGVALINEMQALLIDSLLSRPKLKNEIINTLQQRIDAYNKAHYFAPDQTGKTDHLVFYGFYTEEVARVLGIHFKLRECLFSLKKLYHYFFFPNNSFKYRQNGIYKIENCDQLIKRAYKDHRNYEDVFYYFICFVFYRIFFMEATIITFLRQDVPIWLSGLFLFFQLTNARSFVIFVQYYFGLFKMLYFLAFFILMPFVPSVWILVMLLADIIFTFIRRRMGRRTMFNDLHVRGKFREFFYSKYLPTLKKAREMS